MSNYLSGLRQLVYANERAARAVFNAGDGTDIGIAHVLNDPLKLTAILRWSMRLGLRELEALVAPLIKLGATTEKATWNDCENVRAWAVSQKTRSN